MRRWCKLGVWIMGSFWGLVGCDPAPGSSDSASQISDFVARGVTIQLEMEGRSVTASGDELRLSEDMGHATLQGGVRLTGKMPVPLQVTAETLRIDLQKNQLSLEGDVDARTAISMERLP